MVPTGSANNETSNDTLNATVKSNETWKKLAIDWEVYWNYAV